MPSKYFTSAIKAVLCLAVTPLVDAQDPAPSPTPIPGYIRFWNMLPPASGALDLRKFDPLPTQPALVANATAYRYSSYAAFPTGRYRLGVYKSHDAHSALELFDLNLTPNSFFTILVSPAGIELINDTTDPKATAGVVTIRNYFRGISVAISTGAKPVATLAYGRSFQMNDLALTGSPLTLRTRLPDGKPAEFRAEPDFKSSKRATVLIIPDSYGRFRPRVTVDGNNI